MNLLPREKFQQLGAHALSDAELLAIFLQTGTKNKTVLQLASELLQQFGGLSELLHTKPRSLEKIIGMGTAKITILQATLELCQRYLREGIHQQPQIKCRDDLLKFITVQLKPEKVEVFACIFLDPNLSILHFQKIFYGTLTEVTVYPREIARIALEHNADSIILAHNHPHGKAIPSQADITLTKTIKQTMAMLDIATIDHIIIGKSSSFVFTEQGLL